MHIRLKAFLSLSAVLLFLFTNCKNKEQDSDVNLRSVILVSPLPKGDFSSRDYSGTIEEGKSINASFMADGKISSLNVKEGDRVRKGQLLASLDDVDYKIGVNQLRQQLDQMTSEKARMDEMYKRHNIAPNDYEKFSAGYEQLKLQMQMAENKLGYTKLYSPSDGYISEKFMEPGELVGAGTPIYKITDDSKLLANVDLPVNVFLNKEKIIKALGYSQALPDAEIPLTIESFTPDADNNMLYKMKLSIPSKQASLLTPGLNIRVRIEMQDSKEEGFEIPSRAIVKEEGQTYVWVYNPNDSTIQKQNVNITGIPEGKKIIVSGLTGNERIIETGVKQLYEGEKVNVVDNSDFGL